MQRRRLNHLKEDLQMAMLPCKRLFIATLVLLLLFSVTARARFLREVSDVAKKSNEASKVAKKSNGDKLVPNQDSELDGDDLAAMDYTPAGKTPPIHN
ncbi:hypothetical protein TIFTF001_004127 [Ficus carica]|uniref:Uncharacterized protein n=1 Tax=Ficus carica TaxID=3494 RepID=A0AA87ZAK1_FICCA|nr:hypothetical protein TIFTF001_004127 [Ficus carica]